MRPRAPIVRSKPLPRRNSRCQVQAQTGTRACVVKNGSNIDSLIGRATPGPSVEDPPGTPARAGSSGGFRPDFDAAGPARTIRSAFVDQVEQTWRSWFCVRIGRPGLAAPPAGSPPRSARGPHELAQPGRDRTRTGRTRRQRRIAAAAAARPRPAGSVAACSRARWTQTLMQRIAHVLGKQLRA